ncbi:MAG: YraN family protein [Candidatus Symbiobacter sp.]|nr:YraN family protein [Candidatus Symbiobacter sp.]
MTMTPNMREKRGKQGWRRGFWAESLAAFYLGCCGYKILARRFAHPLGEIDVIARRGDVVAFIEVKARPEIDQAYAGLPRRQQQRIERAAQIYLAQHPGYSHHTLRFDLIVIRPWHWPVHLRDYWRPDRAF